MTNLKIGDSPSPFSLAGTDDQQHSLDDYGDSEAVAVIFSCNHCPYVRAWEDRMVQIQADYAAKGVQLIAINANDAVQYPADDFPSMKQRASEKSFNFPYLHDETQEVARAYGAERTPEVFLLSKEGRLHYHGAIDDNYEDPAAIQAHYLRDALDAVLDGRTSPVAETKPAGCTIKWK